MCDNAKVRGWIPTADMLPPDNVKVIGAWHDSDAGTYYETCWYGRLFGWDSTVDETIRFNGDPIYWMHIPEVPKGDDARSAEVPK